MVYKEKARVPKRDDIEYKEIEEFEDFELINNAFYEMGIRTEGFKELTKKYTYCDKLSEKIKKLITWEDPLKNIQNGDYTEKDTTVFVLKGKSPKENFEEALKLIENDNLQEYNEELHGLLKLDLEDFIKKIDISFLEDKTNEELIEHYSLIENFLCIIPEIIKKDYFINFYSFYYTDEEDEIQKNVEYEESTATSLYIKREYKNNHYIETIIDRDNDKITKTVYPLPKRKLLTDHILKFSSNHLILYKQAIQFLDDFLNTTKIKLKKQIALANAFFCYDYYQYRIEYVDKQKKECEKQNLENIILQDAIKSIESIENDTYLSYQQKSKDKAPYEEVIQHEELKKLKNLKKPALHKESSYYIFDESKFLKSGINRSTALKYYQWIKPYIDGDYIKLINTDTYL